MSATGAHFAGGELRRPCRFRCHPEMKHYHLHLFIRKKKIYEQSLWRFFSKNWNNSWKKLNLLSQKNKQIALFRYSSMSRRLKAAEKKFYAEPIKSIVVSTLRLPFTVHRVITVLYVQSWVEHNVFYYNICMLFNKCKFGGALFYLSLIYFANTVILNDW